MKLFLAHIADIPTTLIEAFRATLNDAIDAHLLVHVCDISHPDHLVQQKIVIQTLNELNVSPSKIQSMITVFNKSDLLEKEVTSLEQFNSGKSSGLFVSCNTGQGLDQLMETIQNKLMVASERVSCQYRVLQGGQLYQTLVDGNICSIESMTVDENDPQFIHLKCLFSKSSYAKFQSRFPGAAKYQVSLD